MIGICEFAILCAIGELGTSMSWLLLCRPFLLHVHTKAITRADMTTAAAPPTAPAMAAVFDLGCVAVEGGCVEVEGGSVPDLVTEATAKSGLLEWVRGVFR